MIASQAFVGVRRSPSHEAHDLDGEIRISGNPRSPGAHVDLKLVRRVGMWELNGEPMGTAGEVIANIGLVLEHLDRELLRTAPREPERK